MKHGACSRTEGQGAVWNSGDTDRSRRSLSRRTIAGLVCAAALIAAIVGTGCSASGRKLPPYAIQFDFAHSPGRGEPRRAFDRDEPLIAHFYACKRDGRAFPPEAPFARMPFRLKPSARRPAPRRGPEQKWLHPFVFVVKDPDGLIYRWYRFISDAERKAERERWLTEREAIQFSLDLRRWVPEDFPWHAGRYEVRAVTFASSLEYDGPFQFGPAVFYMDSLPEKDAPPRGQLLKATLGSDKASYKVGEFITLRAHIENVGKRPVLVQTRYPFLEGRLVDRPAGDSFPDPRPVVRPRYADFTALEPGRKVLLFEERFVAGHWDPQWRTGTRTEWFPGPFAGPDREIVYRLKSDGLFPDDLLPHLGVWSGELESNAVKIAIEREHD